ncbi:uncharacterized protein LOC119681180 [Teleopsis dalmanni]|uniref:uncharacterized protein LOC119681180 n=1 Tax=Teleopsis dalmanni TaxID=139649 RepID=UPI0018CCFA13|nr:uncharacterized protein LOC119681180 [Teleopsis dalmanni]
MESVQKAHKRLRNYPVLLAKCANTAATYAACVTRELNVEKNVCEKEFQEFKKCLQKVAKEGKMRL